MVLKKACIKIVRPLDVVDEAREIERYIVGGFNIVRIEFLIKGKSLSEVCHPEGRDIH